MSVSSELQQQTSAIRDVIRSRPNTTEIRDNGASSSNHFISVSQSRAIKPCVPINKTKYNVERVSRSISSQDFNNDLPSYEEKVPSYEEKYNFEHLPSFGEYAPSSSSSCRTDELQLLQNEVEYYMKEFQKEHKKCKKLSQDLYKKTRDITDINIHDELSKISFAFSNHNESIIRNISHEELFEKLLTIPHHTNILEIMKELIGNSGPKVITIYPIMLNTMSGGGGYNDILTIYTVTKNNVFKSTFYCNVINSGISSLNYDHHHLYKFEEDLCTMSQKMLRSYTKKSSIYKDLTYSCTGESYGSQSQIILHKNEIDRFEDMIKSIPGTWFYPLEAGWKRANTLVEQYINTKTLEITNIPPYTKEPENYI